MDRAEIGPLAGQRRAHQGQVIVLDEDPAADRCDLGHPFGELLVELAVGVPGLRPPMVGPGPVGGVEEVVVAEPEHGVGHHVVGQVENSGSGSTSSIWNPSSGTSPASMAARSASPRAQATQVAPVPASMGRREPASPPDASPATGTPSSKWKATGPRLETITVSTSEPSAGEPSPSSPRRFGAMVSDATPWPRADARRGWGERGLDKIVSNHSQ